MLFDKQNITITVRTVFLLACSMLTGELFANDLIFKVTDQNDELINHAVISAFPQTVQSSAVNSSKQTIVIDQIDKEFIAYVTVIQKGTWINFPNHDQIHHHVYSFSDAKPFDIPLYKGLYENPIQFDKTGVVSLGCNIHDWMSAYIYIADTPYFTTSNKKGRALLELPPGRYKLHYWHPNMDKITEQMSNTITITAGNSQNISIQLHLKKAWVLRRGPLSSFNRGQYR